jgi:hypothetical protein
MTSEAYDRELARLAEEHRAKVTAQFGARLRRRLENSPAAQAELFTFARAMAAADMLQAAASAEDLATSLRHTAARALRNVVRSLRVSGSSERHSIH